MPQGSSESKLEGKEDSSGLDHERLYKYFEAEFDHQSFIDVHAKQSVLVLGYTGAGKSTFINYFAGCRFDPEIQYGYLLQSAQRREGSQPIVAKIGETINSETLFNSFFVDEVGNYISDSPGFGDNRGREAQVCAVMSRYATLKLTKIKSILLLMDHASFIVDRGVGCRNLIQDLSELFEDVEAVAPTITLVVTKLRISNSDEKALQALKDDLKLRLGQIQAAKQIEYDEFVKNNTDAYLKRNKELAKHKQNLSSVIKVIQFLMDRVPNLIVGNVFDNGETAAVVKDLIRKSNVILPIESFLLPDYTAEVVDFNSFMTKMVEDNGYLFELHQSMISQAKLNNEISSLQVRLDGLQKSQSASEQLLQSQDENLKLMSENEKKLNNDQIDANNEKIKEYEADLVKLIIELKELDVFDADVYQKFECIERRPWWGFFGYSEKIVRYSGIPFLGALEFRDGAIYSLVENSPNRFAAGPKIFRQQKETNNLELKKEFDCREADGIVNFVYQSKFNHSGYMTYTIRVPRKRIPANVVQIANLNALILHKKKEVRELRENNGRLTQQNEDYNSCKSIEERCGLIETNLKQVKQDLVDKQSELQEYESLLSPNRDLFIQRHAQLKLICTIEEVMGMFIHQRNLLDAFIASYYHVCTLLDQPAIDIRPFVRQLSVVIAKEIKEEEKAAPVREDEELSLEPDNILPGLPAQVLVAKGPNPAGIESCVPYDVEDGSDLSPVRLGL